MTYGNNTLIKCLCTINDYIIEEGLDLSTYADTLEKKKYPEDMINNVRIAIDNIRESLREIYPDVPDLYYRSVVEEINKIKDKPITVNDLMNV